MASHSPSKKVKPDPKRVLVTGAGGFLGSHISKYFGSMGWQVAGVGRFRATLNIAEAYPNLVILGGMTLPDTAFTRIVCDFKPDLVIHAAGTASVGDSVREPYVDFQRTVDVCAFVLETLRRYAPSAHFVLLSSASLYGNPEKLPLNEAAPIKPISPYGYHKIMCEELVREYGNLHELSTSILRIFSAYGEGLRRQVVHDLCDKILTTSGEEVEVFGTGMESRDFIHAYDIARAIECVYTQKAKGVYNLGSGEETRILDLFKMLTRELRIGKRPRFIGESRMGDPKNWLADISALKKLGFKPTLHLRTGLKNYCRWLIEQRNTKSVGLGGWTAVAPQGMVEVMKA